MSSFFQTNPKAAEKLYSQVCNYVFEEKINDGDVILDCILWNWDNYSNNSKKK